MAEYRKQHPFEKRLQEANRVLDKYQDRIPVLVERAYNEKDLPQIDKKKFLVPKDITCGQFSYVIRKRLQLTEEKALFMFVGSNNIMPPVSLSMGEIYRHHHDDDHFLTILYNSESVFG